MFIGWPFDPSTATSEFGETKGRKTPHGGIDFGVLGDIKATGDGVVEFNGWLNGNGGYSTRVRYSPSLQVLYCHMPKAGPCKAGTKVSPGTVLGEVGESGNAFGRHLHAETIVNGVRVDPRTVFGGSAPAGGGSAPQSHASLRAVQQKLKASYPLYAGKLVVDGIDGPATRAAVMEFQRRSGLVADGIAGPATRAKLGVSGVPAPAPAPSPAAGGSAALRAVQAKLRTAYPLYAGKLVVDGLNGPATKAAVSEFQRRSGLRVDGIAGPATRAKLGV